MTPDPDAIRARNDAERIAIAAYPHRSCEDTFYSCPMHPGYQGREDRTPENCDCDHDDRLQTVADIDALLAEVAKLRAIVNELGAYPDLSAQIHRKALDRQQVGQHTGPDLAAKIRKFNGSGEK